jgi:Tol biopolymer transport system component
MRKPATVSTLIILMLFTVPVVAQQQTTAGKLLFDDAFNPMPAGPGMLAFMRTDSKIPGAPIEMFLGDLKTGEVTRALPGHNFRKDPVPTAAWSPDGGKLVVPGFIDGCWELLMYDRGSRTGKPFTDLAKYRVDLTDEQVKELGVGPEQQLSFSELRYSPSGDRIVFTMTRLAKTAVWYYDFNTGVSRQITEDRKGYSACLDPDNEHFFYTLMVRKGGDISSDEDIVRQSIVTGQADTLISTRSHEFNPDISPDGKYLLYIKRVEGIDDVYVRNLATGQEQQLTFCEPGQHCSNARWNLDGKAIYVQGAGFAAKPGIYLKEFKPF